MEFSKSIICGTLVKRYKRFLADVLLEDGSLVTVHCPNTGAMTGCAEPGFQVWLCPSTNPKRKLQFTWEVAIDDDLNKIGVNTLNANRIIDEALRAEKISEVSSFSHIQKEVQYGSEKSRIDFLLSDIDGKELYVEVKSVTLLEDGVGKFPDTPTARGQKHLRELTQIAQRGKNAALIFCVQHTGIKKVEIAEGIDKNYYELMQVAIEAGVNIYAYSTNICKRGIVLSNALPFNDKR